MGYRPPKGVRPPQFEGKRTGRPKGSKNHPDMNEVIPLHLTVITEDGKTDSDVAEITREKGLQILTRVLVSGRRLPTHHQTTPSPVRPLRRWAGHIRRWSGQTLRARPR